jgi:hypothetical protein
MVNVELFYMQYRPGTCNAVHGLASVLVVTEVNGSHVILVEREGGEGGWVVT